jgi:hypothetical protein
VRFSYVSEGVGQLCFAPILVHFGGFSSRDCFGSMDRSIGSESRVLAIAGRIKLGSRRCERLILVRIVNRRYKVSTWKYAVMSQ